MRKYTKPTAEPVIIACCSLLAASSDATVEKTSEKASKDYDVLTRRKQTLWDGE